MAAITLDNLAHSYSAHPKGPNDYALKTLNLTWDDGGAYALLGPSGCGKSTLLNIISGLITPSAGCILFDGNDVSSLRPDQRNIAQVFQFPVVYDMMSIYDNLAFPLRNRGAPRPQIERRVKAIADMLGFDGALDRRAAGLRPDEKQKLSMGRGLVRDDVNVVMFDEPLTVIDPHLKWTLRSKLKELHQRVKATMIYVTHDQTEALTFADQVVVMHDGEIVQMGTPDSLFERPAHTFVGYFIGSPGMNLLPARLRDGAVWFQDQRIETENGAAAPDGAEIEIGVRPEFVHVAPAAATEGIRVEIVRIADAGRRRIIDAQAGGRTITVSIGEDAAAPSLGPARLRFDPAQTRLYANSRLVEGAA